MSEYNTVYCVLCGADSGNGPRNSYNFYCSTCRTIKAVSRQTDAIIENQDQFFNEISDMIAQNSHGRRYYSEYSSQEHPIFEQGRRALRKVVAMEAAAKAREAANPAPIVEKSDFISSVKKFFKSIF